MKISKNYNNQKTANKRKINCAFLNKFKLLKFNLSNLGDLSSLFAEKIFNGLFLTEKFFIIIIIIFTI